MKELSPLDQNVLRLMADGIRDEEVCRTLKISLRSFGQSVERIEARAATETDDAGRFYERALKERAKRRVAAVDARLRALMDILPHAVMIVDGRSGRIKEFNEKACALFGYPPNEFEQVTVEDLVPENLRGSHTALRLGFLVNSRIRELGYHPPIFGLRKDGKEIDMSIALTATSSDDDVMVVCNERFNLSGVAKTATEAEREAVDPKVGLG